MIALHTKDGSLKIFNSPDIGSMLSAAGDFETVPASETITLENNGRCLYPNQAVVFPGRVHQVCALHNGVVVLADRFGQNYDPTEESKS